MRIRDALDLGSAQNQRRPLLHCRRLSIRISQVKKRNSTLLFSNSTICRLRPQKLISVCSLRLVERTSTAQGQLCFLTRFQAMFKFRLAQNDQSFLPVHLIFYHQSGYLCYDCAELVTFTAKITSLVLNMSLSSLICVRKTPIQVINSFGPASSNISFPEAYLPLDQNDATRPLAAIPTIRQKHPKRCLSSLESHPEMQRDHHQPRRCRSMSQCLWPQHQRDWSGHRHEETMKLSGAYCHNDTAQFNAQPNSSQPQTCSTCRQINSELYHSGQKLQYEINPSNGEHSYHRSDKRQHVSFDRLNVLIPILILFLMRLCGAGKFKTNKQQKKLTKKQQ